MTGRALTVWLAAPSQSGRRGCNEDALGYWEGAGSRVTVLCDGAGGHGGVQAWLDRLQAGVRRAGRSDQDNYCALAI